MFFKESLVEKQKLLHHPALFFQDFVPGPSSVAGASWLGRIGESISDIEYSCMTNLLAMFNLASADNYYIDVLFFDALILLGPLLCFKLLNENFPGNKQLFYVLLFLLPTIQFWLSGIRSEGLVFLFMTSILYYSSPRQEKMRWTYWCWILLSWLGFLIFRYQYLLVFLPAYLAWRMSKRIPSRALPNFAMVYLVCLLIFLVSIRLSPSMNLASPVVASQNRFMQLHGNTRFALDSLQPSAGSFIRVLPQAISHTFTRPTLGEARGPLQTLTAVEIIFFWSLCLLFICQPRPGWVKTWRHPLILLFFTYALSQILLIGYTVPFPGAIVRYKAIPSLLLLITIGLSIDWKKIHYKFK